MPIWGGRRSRSVSVSRPTTPSSSSSALLAASMAVKASQSQTRLATGAAATALRSHSPANTPVGQVQTKRMMERQSSVGSQNAARGRQRTDNLHRRSSSSSMTERTFREQSPGRPSTATGLPTTRQQEPPVPPLPENYNKVPPIPPKSRHRASSIDEVQVRKGALTKPSNNRNSVADFGPPKAAPSPGMAAARRVISGSTAPQLDRNDSNNSMHFSYPGRSRPISPPPQKQKVESPTQAPRTTPNRTPEQPKKPKQPRQPVQPTPPKQSALDAISQTEAQNIQYQLTQASQLPVKQRKKREGPLAEGSRLQTGTMGQKPTVTPLEPGPPVQEQDSTQDLDRGRNTARLAGQASHFPHSPTSPTDSQTSPSEADRSTTRRVQRASGALQKQPSVVREDWEGERDDTSSPVDSSPIPVKALSSKRQTTEANMSRKIDGNNTKMESDQQDVSAPSQSLTTPEPRRPSLSPSRSTRFSNRLSSDMAEGQKHVPPPRSVSPRKPALKHAHSPQLQPIDAKKARDSSLSPSEATDQSDLGLSKPKKGAHVKFDTHPAVVGVAAEPISPESPQIVSPQHREKKWFSMTRKPQNRVALSEDSDDDDAMKPRPMLPTFGSVRDGRRKEAEPASSQKVISTPSPSTSSSSLSSETDPTTMNTSVSSDHAIGGLLARRVELNQKDISAPLPPQVTSVEGTGMHSDTDSTYSQDGRDDQQLVQQSTMAQPQLKVPEANDLNGVPSIAVQPATPGTEEEQNRRDQWLVEIPGGFPSAGQDTTSTAPATSHQQATVSQSDTESTRTIDQSPSDLPETRQERMPSIQEESDRDSVYSDAAEDLSDLEGDGFGSINAIVRSPVVTSPEAPSPAVQSADTSGPRRNVERDSEQESHSWADTEARWKDHATNAKLISLQPAPVLVEKSAQQPRQMPTARAAAGRAPKLASSPTPTTGSTATPAQSPSPAVLTKKARTGTQPAFKKSMRSEPEENTTPTLRNKSRDMPNNEGPKPLRSSMRDAASAPKSMAPVNQPAQVQGSFQKQSLRTTTPSSPPTRQMPPPVNDDSDSESSFRRRRRARANDPGKHSMRKSMRAGAGVAAESSAAPVNRPAVRSTSPPVERRPLSSASAQPAMRSTLRGSTDSVPTLRGNQNGERRSSSLFGRKKEAKAPTRPLSAVGTFGKSRFADSDDEDGDQPKTFKSRFGDSSDEEDELRPVRGIPRNNKNDDSTDLDDSSDEETNKRKTETQPKKLSVVVPASPPTSERPTSPTSPDGKKKRGFFNRLRKSKDESASPKNKESTATINGNEDSAKPPARDADTTALGFKSDAEKEALIEQTRQKLEAAREQPSLPPAAKIQRRNTPQRIMSDSWPLPAKTAEDDDAVERPVTSDGTQQPKRPEFERQPSSGTAASSPTGSGEAFGKGGKKKRFPLLRKAFGLKD